MSVNLSHTVCFLLWETEPASNTSCFFKKWIFGYCNF